MAQNAKRIRRLKIKHQIRKKIQGTSERPRLVVSPSNTRIYLQLIDDTKAHTLLGLSVKGKNMEAGIKAGEQIAQEALKKKIERVVYDRNGKLYHGVVKAISEKAREIGLKH